MSEQNQEDLEQAGLDAVDRFITTWNSRDPEAWADSLNYPHVRPAHFGETRVFASAEEYAANVDFQQVIDSGWDHSEWDYRQVLHTSASKIHVAGQWSRYSPEGNVILTTPIVYVCTKVEGKWGIQSRFAADYVDEDTDTTELLSRGLGLIQDYVNQSNADNREAGAELLNYPHLDIHAGDVTVTEQPSDFHTIDPTVRIESLFAVQTGKHTLNAAVDLEVENGDKRQGVIHLNDRDGHLGIQAWSILDPNEASD